jgi:SsrA-binding protein
MAYNIDIGDYSNAPPNSHEHKRPRRLLAHRREIERLRGLTTASGTTMVPLTMYFNSRGILKMEIGVAQGKRHQDKRETIKKKEAEQAMRKAMSRRKIG